MRGVRLLTDDDCGCGRVGVGLGGKVKYVETLIDVKIIAKK